MNALSLNSVVLSEDEKELVILDQTLLPCEVKYLHLSKAEDIWEAIYALRVRGAPAIGVAAAYGIYLLSAQLETGDMDAFCDNFRKQKAYLDSARPTAVNLSWALKRMENVLDENKAVLSIADMKKRLLQEAHAIREEDIAISRSIGQLGFELLHHGDGILTHCNAGTLATAKYGTALAPVYVALENGWDDLRVYCDETRPLLQGARLSAFEMQTAGVDTTLLCDNMASLLMKRGKVDIIFVGCDRMAANGDFANKIGTSAVAILAKHYGIPIFTCVPTSTIDLSIATGDEIVIEERKPEEVTEAWYAQRMAPEGVKVFNPAFDVTDHTLITGVITEKGIAYPPFDKSFEKLGIKPKTNQ